jgi:hypothetical protein
MTDGHLNKCKDCTKNDVRIREGQLKKDPEWVRSERERHRNKYYRLNYKDKHKPSKEQKKKIMKRYYEKYPEKLEARNKCAHIKKEKGYNNHHWSYNKEHYKDIIVLKESEHFLLHRYLIYDQERMKYRSAVTTKSFSSGELLDTKESHLLYYNEINQYYT